MPSASCTRPQRTIEQRFLLLVLVAALFLAPLLATAWPAFGKGPMLFIGETPAQQADQIDHADHAGHEGHAAPAGEPHHQQHCALCVLAFLGWAPPADLCLGCAAAVVTDRAAWFAAHAPALQQIWRSARARAPPLS